MFDENQDTYVCDACIGDDFFRDEIRSEGERIRCAFCRQYRQGVSLETLAGRIHEVIQKHFHLTPRKPNGLDYALAKEGLWKRPGEPVDHVIVEITAVKEPIAKAVQECLSDLHGCTAVRDGEEDPYADDALYEESSIDDWKLRETWNFFRTEMTSRARFFNQHAQGALEEIFGGLDYLRTYDGTPVIRYVKPGDGQSVFYRARCAFSDMDLKEILGAPVEKLGPPSSSRPKAARMNAAGISVFYGAMEEETCIAEARAPVGSYVVIGRFEIVRPVRLLDFDTLTKVYVEGSHFDPEYHTRRSRAGFLGRLVREVSRPVLPRDKEFEYLPTQAVSEYLAEQIEPRLDGIVFHSSQTAGQGRNVVLFNHACGVLPYELPEGSEIRINMGGGSEDDLDDRIAVFETVPAEPAKEGSEAPSADLLPSRRTTPKPILLKNDTSEFGMCADPTLKLDVDSIRVLVVRGVHYEYDIRKVGRHRLATSENESETV